MGAAHHNAVSALSLGENNAGHTIGKMIFLMPANRFY